MVNLNIFGNEIYLVFPKISGIFILELENNRKLYFMTTIEQTKDFTSDYLTSDEIHRLCRYFNKLGNHRMELLCLFQTKTLLRYSDIQRIRWIDVLDKDVLVLNEKKTSKRRTITLSQSLKNDIRKTYINSTVMAFIAPTTICRYIEISTRFIFPLPDHAIPLIL